MYTLKTCPVHIGNVLFAFCLLFHLSKLLWNPSARCSYAIKRALLLLFPASKRLFLLYKTIDSNEEMATMSVYQCNVLQYSFFFFKRKKQKTNVIFKERVLLFAFCVVHTFCLNGPAEQTKLLIFILFYFLHNSHLLFKNSVFHLCHFDSLSLWIIKKKKTFSKYSTPLQLVDLFKWMDLDFKVKAAPVWRHPHTNTYAHRLGCYLRCDSDVKSIANVQFFLWPRNLQSLTRRLCHCFVSRKPILILRKYRRLVADFRTTRKTPTRRL